MNDVVLAILMGAFLALAILGLPFLVFTPMTLLDLQMTWECTQQEPLNNTMPYKYYLYSVDKETAMTQETLASRVQALRDALEFYADSSKRGLKRMGTFNGGEVYGDELLIDNGDKAKQTLANTETLVDEIRQATEWMPINTMPLKAIGLCSGDADYDSEVCVNDGSYIKQMEYKWWLKIPPLPKPPTHKAQE